MALTWDDITSITQNYFIPKLTDNIFKSNAMFQRLKKSHYETWDGGKKILVPLLYAKNTAGGWYSGAATLDVSSNSQITAAEFAPKYAHSSLTVTRQDELENGGDAQIVNFVKARVEAAERYLADLLGTGVFSDGTTDTQSIVGLKAMVNTTNTYGGISGTDYSWWRAQKDATSTTPTVPVLRALMGTATIDSDKPTCAVGLQAVYDDIYANFQPQQRFQDSESANAGFTSIMFDGIPVLVDSHVDSGYCYMVNENYLKLLYHPKETFKFDGFIKPTNQNVMVAHVYWAGALVTTNRRMHGVLTNLS